MDERIEAMVRCGWILTFQPILDDHHNSIVMGIAMRGNIIIRKIGWNKVNLTDSLLTECAVHTPALLDEY